MTDTKKKAAFSKWWAALMSFLAFVAALSRAIEALQKVFPGDKRQLITEFLPDLAIVLLLLALIPLIFQKNGIDWWDSVKRIGKKSKFKLTLLILLTLSMIALVGFLWSPIQYFYVVRYQRTLMDWHAIQAIDQLRVKNYESALKELRGVSEWEYQISVPEIEEDIKGRLKDADTLVRRFNEHKKSGRAPSFEEILMIGRAARLASRSPNVSAAIRDGRAILEKALAEYQKAIYFLQNNDFTSATVSLKQSQATCRGLLDQELLIRYITKPDLTKFNDDERDKISYYLKTLPSDLEDNLLNYPPFAIFRLHLHSNLKTSY